ncbi:hypothetical protein PRUPE_4G109700 [Prunus persica]|uniref:Uncharacterized protein n=1 Tax=Prunus persica TaxID=3760 RepID=A0A251PIV4_PRUPE|nr:hypothetical protein PRUPE_4G109700 [Prunus persica]
MRELWAGVHVSRTKGEKACKGAWAAVLQLHQGKGERARQRGSGLLVRCKQAVPRTPGGCFSWELAGFIKGSREGISLGVRVIFTCMREGVQGVYPIGYGTQMSPESTKVSKSSTVRAKASTFSTHRTDLNEAANPIFNARTKHVKIDYHYIRQLITSNSISISHVSSPYQIADTFTKSLPKAQFQHLSSMLIIVSTQLRLRAYVKKQNNQIIQRLEREEKKYLRHSTNLHPNQQSSTVRAKASTFSEHRIVLNETGWSSKVLVFAAQSRSCSPTSIPLPRVSNEVEGCASPTSLIGRYACIEPAIIMSIALSGCPASTKISFSLKIFGLR